jgi:hypothetical protein
VLDLGAVDAPVERRDSRRGASRRAGLEDVVTEERLVVGLRGCGGRQVCWEPEVQEDLADDAGF